jgi:hypothetical protein
MTIYRVRDPQTPIGTVLDEASADGVLVETDNHVSHAILPLDDDLLDYLIERNPAFIEECRGIRARMRAGEAYSHDDVRRILDAEG